AYLERMRGQDALHLFDRFPACPPPGNDTSTRMDAAPPALNALKRSLLVYRSLIQEVLDGHAGASSSAPIVYPSTHTASWMPSGTPDDTRALRHRMLRKELPNHVVSGNVLCRLAQKIEARLTAGPSVTAAVNNNEDYLRIFFPSSMNQAC